MTQKYHRGDRVLLKKKFPSYMSHFDGKGMEAIVQYSYEDRYGALGGGDAEYSLLILGDNPHSVAWYEDGNIKKLVRSGHPEDMKLLRKHRED